MTNYNLLVTIPNCGKLSRKPVVAFLPNNTVSPQILYFTISTIEGIGK